MKPTPMVSMHGVAFVYEDGTEALRSIDLEIEKGTAVGIAGMNGSGKTTLCKLMNALLVPTEGTVLVGGEDTRGASTPKLAKSVGYLFQNPDHQIFLSTVLDEVAFGLQNIGLCEGEVRSRAMKWLEALDLTNSAQTPPLMLSLGERRLVSIAATLAMDQELIVLDEPTAWLDAGQAALVEKAIAGLISKGTTVIIISHNMRLLANLTRRLIIMAEGRIVEDSPTSELMSKPEKLSVNGLAEPPLRRLRTAIGLGPIQDGGSELDDLSERFRARQEGS